MKRRERSCHSKEGKGHSVTPSFSLTLSFPFFFQPPLPARARSVSRACFGSDTEARLELLTRERRHFYNHSGGMWGHKEFATTGRLVLCRGPSLGLATEIQRITGIKTQWFWCVKCLLSQHTPTEYSYMPQFQTVYSIRHK